MAGERGMVEDREPLTVGRVRQVVVEFGLGLCQEITRQLCLAEACVCAGTDRH